MPTTRSKPAICPVCEDTFKDLRGLNGHMRFKHNMSTEEVQEELDAFQKDEEQLDVIGEIFDLMDELDAVDRRKQQAKKRREKATGAFLSSSGDTDVKQAMDSVLEKLDEKEERIRKRLQNLNEVAQANDNEADEEAEVEGEESSAISWLK